MTWTNDFRNHGKVTTCMMGDRDRYDWELECPACSAKGHAFVSEDAFPEPGQLNFGVDRISAGFRLRKLGQTASDTVIVCVNCEKPI